jgi:hypothetical protein
MVWKEVAKQEQKAAMLAQGQQPPAEQPAEATPPEAQTAGPAQQAQRVVLADNAAPAARLSATGTYTAIVDNKEIQDDREAYVKALLPHVEKAPDGLGIVVAVNGKILAADVYGSSALFRKLTRKLLDLYALEATLARDPKRTDVKAPARDAVLAFLAEPAKAKGKDESLAESMHLRTQETAKTVRYEYRDFKANASAEAAPVHQNYLAK